MDTRYDYRLYCKTESRWVEGTTKTTNPDYCFNNNSHTIEPTSVQLLGTIAPTTVVLKEEEITTNGNYKCECMAFDCPPGITTKEISFPYAINLLSTSSVLGEEHRGNVLNVYFIPDSVIGVTTLPDGANRDSELIVGSTATANIFVGVDVSATDYLGTESLGTVVAVNGTKITVSGDPPRAFTDAVLNFSKPTYNSTYNEIDTSKIFVGMNAIVNDKEVIVQNLDPLAFDKLFDVSTNPNINFYYNAFSTASLKPIRPLNVLATNDTAVQYAQTGYQVKITDGVKTNLLGRVTEVDKARKHITTEFVPIDTFDSGAYIMVTRYFIENFEFGAAGTYDFSKGRNKGSYIDKSRRGKFEYHNKTNNNVRFIMQLEYLH